jgi:hypothetical protein
MRSGDHGAGRQGAFGLPVQGALLEQNQQDYATQIAKALGLQGKIPGQVDPEIQIGITLDDFTKPEFQFLRRRNLWQGRGVRVATPANLNYVCLPGVPGTLTVVTKITIVNSNAAAGGSSIGLATANAVMTLGGTAPRDTRLVGGVPACIPYTGTAVGPTIPVGRAVTTPAGGTTVVECEYVLGANPGTVLTVVDTVVNQQIDVSFEWSERPLLPTEQ